MSQSKWTKQLKKLEYRQKWHEESIQKLEKSGRQVTGLHKPGSMNPKKR